MVQWNNPYDPDDEGFPSVEIVDENGETVLNYWSLTDVEDNGISRKASYSLTDDSIIARFIIWNPDLKDWQLYTRVVLYFDPTQRLP